MWPGDVPLSRSIQLEIGGGDNIDLSSLTSTVHIGAHADSRSHYSSRGQGIEAVPLEPYIGPCYVVKSTGALISKNDCRVAIEAGAKRVLFRTDSFDHNQPFSSEFTAFSTEAIEWLGANGVRLVGIDTPSVDPFDSKDLPVHHELIKFNIYNLEGLVLSGVEDGWYELVALPLKLKGFDASPVRAILRRPREQSSRNMPLKP